MGSSRMIATRKYPVFMSHICSKCGFPVVSIITVEAQSQKTYTFLREKAAKIASETAERAIEKEIKKIESCRRTKTPLEGKSSGKSMISPGYFCSSSFSGYTTACPYCSHIEPWKNVSNNSQHLINQLSDQNFPCVFREAEKAEAWANTFVLSIIESINKKHADQNEVNRSIQKAVASSSRINEWEKQLVNIPELEVQRKLESQLVQLKARFKSLGVLDIKEKKEVKTNMSIIELKLNDINSLISSQEAPIKTSIASEQIELLYSQAIAFGCSGDIVSKNKDNTFVYFYSPNPIPEEYYGREYEAKGMENPILVNTESKLDEKSSLEGGIQESVPIFCRKCGFRLLPGSVFCTKCGTRIEVSK